MKKHIMIFVLTLSLVMSLLPLAALATEVENTGEALRQEYQCGEDMEWLVEDGVLTIVGTGEMDDFEKGAAPWEAYKEEITSVVFSGEISYIGSYAFYDYDGITEVDFGECLYEIGAYAFYDCDGLTAIHMPATFKIFGERCFSGASRLKEIHCAGKFPSFRESCLWDVYCNIYFPVNSPWSVKNIADLETAFKGRIEFLASDGSDPYTPEEETEETTQPTTEAATEAPTEAVTEAATESVTEAETATETVTEETTPAAAESAPTEPEATGEESEPQEETAGEEEEKSSGSKAWIAVLVIGAVLIILNAGALIFRGKGKGKYSGR